MIEKSDLDTCRQLLRNWGREYNDDWLKRHGDYKPPGWTKQIKSSGQATVKVRWVDTVAAEQMNDCIDALRLRDELLYHLVRYRYGYRASIETLEGVFSISRRTVFRRLNEAADLLWQDWTWRERQWRNVDRRTA